MAPSILFDRTEMAAYDTLSATSYMVLYDQPKPYYWVNNYGDLGDLYKNMITDQSDSILYQKNVNNDGVKGYEILIQKKDANTFKRSRILWGHNGAYILSVSSQRDALFTPNVDRFFNGFKQQAGLRKFDYLEPKPALLLKTLNDADSSKRAAAIEYLSSAPFSANDVDLLNRHLFNAYQPAYPLADSFEVAETISAQLQKISAPSTITYIKDYYPAIASQDQARKNIALATLAGITTAESYQTLASILPNAGLSESLSTELRSNLTDSLSLTASIAPSLLALSADSIYTPGVAAIMLALIDSNLVKPEVLKPFAASFVAHARKVVNNLTDSTAYDYQLSDLIKLLPLLADEEANKALKEFQSVADMDLQLTAVLTLLKHGMAADPKVIEQIALDRSYRVYLFQMLSKIDQQQLFPQKLLNQRSFAESYVFNASEDYLPAKVEFVGEKEASIGQQNYRFLLFRLIFEEGDERSEFLGIAGGYTLSTDLEPETDVTGIYWDEEYIRNKVDTQFKNYISSFNEE